MSELTDADLADVIALEQRLLDPQARRNRSALLDLLHEDFCEFGMSGRVYDRDGIVETLLASDELPAKASDFRATRLGSNFVLVTYRTDTPTLRTSIWSRRHGGWQLLHHQGTPTAP